MTSPELTERDPHLLAALIDTLPRGVPPEQHQEDIASILEFVERLHVEHGAVLPGWLVLGRQLHLSHLIRKREPHVTEVEATDLDLLTESGSGVRPRSAGAA